MSYAKRFSSQGAKKVSLRPFGDGPGIYEAVMVNVKDPVSFFDPSDPELALCPQGTKGAMSTSIITFYVLKRCLIKGSAKTGWEPAKNMDVEHPDTEYAFYSPAPAYPPHPDGDVMWRFGDPFALRQLWQSIEDTNEVPTIAAITSLADDLGRGTPVEFLVHRQGVRTDKQGRTWWQDRYIPARNVEKVVGKAAPLLAGPEPDPDEIAKKINA